RLGKPTVPQDKVSAKSSLNRSLKQSHNRIRLTRKCLDAAFVALRTLGQTLLHLAKAIRQLGRAEHDKNNGCEAEAIRPSEREHVVAAGISPRRMIEDAGQQLGFLAAIPAKNRIINDERSNAGRRG